ncbi:flagellar hook-associated protein FlgK [Porticoccaceae bacterium LTM1]|nr:flagellar hook-associated protein FlgK [Porticoccaceae bacterium LTM1]
MADIFGIGTSALLSLQQAISTTGHNISNVNTEGYSRQSVTFATRNAQDLGSGYLGSGMEVQSIRRSYDGFLAEQVLNRNSSYNSLESYHNLAAQLDGLLGNNTSGLSSSMQNFFDALQGVANDPTSLPARQVLLGESQTMVDRVHYLDQNLQALESSASTSIQAAVQEINGITQGIADLNAEIAVATLSNPGNPPNDLLDQRDVLVNHLSEKIGVKTITQEDGSINVLVGNGQPLVVGNQVQMLQAVPNSFIPARMEIAFAGLTDNAILITDQVRGGELEGLINFRTEILDQTRNELGRLVYGLTEVVNNQHQLGIDLNGQVGGEFFAPLSPQVLDGVNNSGTANVSITIDDASSLDAADYTLNYDGSQWVLRNHSDKSVQTFATLPQSLGGITISSTGIPATGDRFYLQPLSTAISDFDLVVNDVKQIAAAGPLRGSSDLSNTGNAQITDLSVGSSTGMPLAGDITLTFNPNAFGAGVPGWDVSGGPAGPLAYDPTSESGGKSFTLSGYGDATFSVSGVPAAGDRIVISNNNGGIGDNSNALKLAGLQTTKFMDGGSASVGDMYGRTVAKVGVRTNQAKVNLTTEEGLLNNAVEAQRGISGVNLDEEAANLMRYQQAYQAVAQIISAADNIFQSLLQATRR